MEKPDLNLKCSSRYRRPVLDHWSPVRRSDRGYHFPLSGRRQCPVGIRRWWPSIPTCNLRKRNQILFVGHNPPILPYSCCIRLKRKKMLPLPLNSKSRGNCMGRMEIDGDFRESLAWLDNIDLTRTVYER